MKYEIIASSSRGNAICLDHFLLLDCGVTYRHLREVVGSLGLVLLTHRHRDHINPNTLKRLARERPMLRFGCCEWMLDEISSCVPPERIDVYKPGRKYSYGAWAVSPVKLYHDVPQCGYRVYHGEEKAFFATDTAHLLGIEAKGYDLYLIEANYGEDEIKDRIDDKLSRGEFAYEMNVPERHLSREQASEFILANAGDDSEVVFLHQHIEKEQPSRAVLSRKEGSFAYETRRS